MQAAFTHAAACVASRGCPPGTPGHKLVQQQHKVRKTGARESTLAAAAAASGPPHPGSRPSLRARAKRDGSSCSGEAASGGARAPAHATAAFFLPAVAFFASLAAAAFFREPGEVSSVEAVRLMARSSSE